MKKQIKKKKIHLERTESGIKTVFPKKKKPVFYSYYYIIIIDVDVPNSPFIYVSVKLFRILSRYYWYPYNIWVQLEKHKNIINRL